METSSREERVYIPITQQLKDELDSHRAYLSYDQYIGEMLIFFTVPPHTVSREI